MAKELTHILIAQDVVRQLQGSGQHALVSLIKSNLPAYYLGSIIPDALFYDVPPFRLKPKKHLWISQALHEKERAKNDQKAVSFFSSISAHPRMWPSKLAFSAGIITHTVVDRTFHDLIEYYTTTLREKGADAVATHREIETLADIALLRAWNLSPRQFALAPFIHLDQATKYSLFHFYLTHLIGNGMAPERSLLNVLKRATEQQRFFIKLFATRPLYHVMEISNKLAAGRLRAWRGFFYPPDEVKPRCFPLLAKLRLNSTSDERLFNGGLRRLKEAALNEAIRYINMALTTFAQGKSVLTVP